MTGPQEVQPRSSPLCSYIYAMKPMKSPATNGADTTDTANTTTTPLTLVAPATISEIQTPSTIPPYPVSQQLQTQTQPTHIYTLTYNTTHFPSAHPRFGIVGIIGTYSTLLKAQEVGRGWLLARRYFCREVVVELKEGNGGRRVSGGMGGRPRARDVMGMMALEGALRKRGGGLVWYRIDGEITRKGERGRGEEGFDGKEDPRQVKGESESKEEGKGSNGYGDIEMRDGEGTEEGGEKCETKWGCEGKIGGQRGLEEGKCTVGEVLAERKGGRKGLWGAKIVEGVAVCYLAISARVLDGDDMF